MGRVWRVRCDARGVQLIIDVPTDAAQQPVVATDARRLRQVLDGLAENALRMVPPGRPLVLHVGREPSAGPLVSVVLQVRDGGPGLAADDYLAEWRNDVVKQLALAVFFTLLLMTISSSSATRIRALMKRPRSFSSHPPPRAVSR